VAEATIAGEMKRSLSLTGVTGNALALIAPGAFLWTTFQLQWNLRNANVANHGVLRGVREPLRVLLSTRTRERVLNA